MRLLLFLLIIVVPCIGMALDVKTKHFHYMDFVQVKSGFYKGCKGHLVAEFNEGEYQIDVMCGPGIKESNIHYGLNGVDTFTVMVSGNNIEATK